MTQKDKMTEVKIPLPNLIAGMLVCFAGGYIFNEVLRRLLG